MKRHEVLKKQLEESPEAVIERCQRRKEKLLARNVASDASSIDAKVNLISHGVGLAVFQHLEFGPVENLKTELNESLDTTLDFFFGDWWQASEDAGYVLNRSAEYPVQGWYQMWTEGLLLADWTDRWEDGERLLAWVNDDVARGISHGDPYLNLSLAMASCFGKKLTKHDEIVQLVETKGSKFEKLTLVQWQAIANQDSDAFAAGLPAAAKQFHKSVYEDVPNIQFAISSELSLAWTAATRLGMDVPSLKPKEDAIIVRRATIWT